MSSAFFVRKGIRFEYSERHTDGWIHKQICCLEREEGSDSISGPQTPMKWADVQQIASRASCSTNVISLSLVIISRSVGWEIQIRLPEGCKRKNSWTRYNTLPTAHVEDVLTTIHMCMLGGTQKLSNRKWSHHPTGETVKSPGQQLPGHAELKIYSVETHPRHPPPVSTLKNIFIFLHVLFL